MPINVDAWPELPLAAWQDTYATLHMWTQIVGHIRMVLTPLVNHWWNVPLYVSARGLTTSPIPYRQGIFEIRFDFIAHKLFIETSEGAVETMNLAPRSVAGFYHEIMRALHSLGIDVTIHSSPDEVANPIPFAQDEVHKSYDLEFAHRFWRILVSADTVLKAFRSRFIGKCSPVHFFWGSFDLAVTRFSGRSAPERPDAMQREAYSHEVISHGFWPGGGDIQGPVFYSYTAPEPPGLKTHPVRPARAFYHTGLSEFLLMYDDVRTAASPEAELMEFCQSTYEAGANLAHWDRSALERVPGDAKHVGG
ncbi:MAG TPA: DUF5996 family protein [Bryobacteraceae bacterium]|nr:DUF5996 family protein [Bryobacteraceae bacterium]